MSPDFPRKGAWLLATWFGCGRAPRAPGTFGTLGALPVYFALAPYGPPAVLGAAAVVTFVGVWAASVVVRDLGKKDPQLVVIDEVAGALLTLAPVAGSSWHSVVAGVLLFRLLDILKPWPIRALERLPEGWGVVMDDVAAGAIGAIAMEWIHVSRILS